MLYDYFDIREGIVVERAQGIEERDKSKQGSRATVAKLLNYKDKEYILKNTNHLKDTNIYIYKNLSKETMAILKSSRDEIKKLRQQGKYAIK